MRSLRQSPLSKSQEKFWLFATIVFPVCRATKIFAAFTWLVSQSRAATANKENTLLQGYSLLLHRPRIISSINTAARSRADMPL